jgi:hypothetical protein
MRNYLAIIFGGNAGIARGKRAPDWVINRGVDNYTLICLLEYFNSRNFLTPNKQIKYNKFYASILERRRTKRFYKERNKLFVLPYKKF